MTKFPAFAAVAALVAFSAPLVAQNPAGGTHAAGQRHPMGRFTRRGDVGKEESQAHLP
jgi:hypothetical protein